MTERPTRTAIAIQLIALAAVLGVAAYRAPDADWNLALLGILLVLGVASDLLRVEVRAYRTHFRTQCYQLAVVQIVLFYYTNHRLEPAAGKRNNHNGLCSIVFRVLPANLIGIALHESN